MNVAGGIPENFSPERISLVAVDFLNRSSSLFFNCLLDDHPQVVHGFAQGYPHVARADAARVSFDNLSGSMIWQYSADDFPFSFAEFEPLFNEYISQFGLSDKTAFVAAHYALAKMLKKDVGKIKWIAYHPHGHDNILSVKRAKLDFPGQKLILTVRDPRAAIWGNLRGNNRVSMVELLPQAPVYWWAYNRIIARSDILVVRHEDIHLDYPGVRKSVTGFLQVPDDSSLDQATLFGRPWDGRSKKAILSNTGLKSTRPDPAFVTDDWKQGFTRFDLFLIQSFLDGFMKEFGYQKWVKRDYSFKPLAFDYAGVWLELCEKSVPEFLRPVFAHAISTPLISLVPKTIIRCIICARTVRNFMVLCKQFSDN